MRETNIPTMKPARATAPVNARNRSPPASAKSSDKGPMWIGAVTATVSVIDLLTNAVVAETTVFNWVT